MRRVTGTLLRHYQVLEELGRGGLGTVYRARDHRHGRDVAIKFLNGRFADPAARARFPDEAKTLARLQHPNIAAFIEFGSVDNIDFLVMEYAEGVTLGHMLASGPLTERDATRIAQQVADALEAAHRCGVVHADLKPTNVILGTDFRVTLLDFGHAHIEGARDLSATGPSRPLASLPYLAPETLVEGVVNRLADVYGLGLLLYEMTTARRPYPDGSRFELAASIVYLDATFPADAARRLSPRFRQAVLTALNKDPRMRHATPTSLLDDLNRGGSS